MQTTSPFGPATTIIRPDSVLIRFSDCQVNGVPFKGDISIKVPDGSDNQFSNKFRADYSAEYLRRTDGNNGYGEKRLSDAAREKIEVWACKHAESVFTPIAKQAAILQREMDILDRMRADYVELGKKKHELFFAMVAQSKKITAIH